MYTPSRLGFTSGVAKDLWISKSAHKNNIFLGSDGGQSPQPRKIATPQKSNAKLEKVRKEAPSPAKQASPVKNPAEKKGKFEVAAMEVEQPKCPASCLQPVMC